MNLCAWGAASSSRICFCQGSRWPSWGSIDRSAVFKRSACALRVSGAVFVSSTGCPGVADAPAAGTIVVEGDREGGATAAGERDGGAKAVVGSANEGEDRTTSASARADMVLVYTR